MMKWCSLMHRSPHPLPARLTHTLAPADLNLHPDKRPVVEDPRQGLLQHRPRLASVFSTLQQAVSGHSGILIGQILVSTSLMPFREIGSSIPEIAHTHTPLHRCQGLCVLSAV